MTTIHPPVSTKRSFRTIFLIEMWERFGYYGMQALIVYYMVQRLGFPDHKANMVWSAAAALIYLSPAIGGWVGDKVLGTRRTTLMGTVVLAIGYTVMAIPGQSPQLLYIALSIIAIGNGLFKPNASNIVRKIYAGDDSRIDSAFTMYYMAVNIGATCSMLLTPWVKNYVNQHWGAQLGWHVAFAISTFGLLIGLINYAAMRHTLIHIGSEEDQKPLNAKKLVAVLGVSVLAIMASTYLLDNQEVARNFVYLAGCSILAIFVWLIKKGHASERPGLIIALVLTVQTVFFMIYYQQMSTSLNLFALRNVNPSFDLFGIHLWNWTPAQFQSFNPIWIFILSPVLATLYTSLASKDRLSSIATRFVMGFAAVTLGFFIFSQANYFAVAGKASSWVMVWGYGLYSLGELLVSALGLAMIARYVPERISGFMMGAYFLSVGVAQYLGGVVANLASIPRDITDPLKTMQIYTALFSKLSWAAVGCTVVFALLLLPLRKLDKTHRYHRQPT